MRNVKPKSTLVISLAFLYGAILSNPGYSQKISDCVNLGNELHDTLNSLPCTRDNLYMVAKMYYDSNQLDISELCLLKAIEIDSIYIDAYLLLGEINYRNNKHEKGNLYLDRVIALDTNCSHYWSLSSIPCIEKRISAWTGSKEAVNINPFKQKSKDIQAIWNKPIFWGNNEITLTRKSKPGSYSFQLFASGDEGEYVLERNAEYKNGVLKLDRAVREYDGDIYDVLYYVKVKDKEYLVPFINEDKVKRMIEKVTNDSEHLKWLTFERGLVY